jgi:hypothetical protein
MLSTAKIVVYDGDQPEETALHPTSKADLSAIMPSTAKIAVYNGDRENSD